MNPLLQAALVAGAATLAQGLIRAYVKNPMIRDYGPPLAMIGGGYMAMRKPKYREMGLALAIVGVVDVASMLVARFLPEATAPSAPAQPPATLGGNVNISGARWGGAFPRGSMYPAIGTPPLLTQNNLPRIAAAEAYADLVGAPMMVAV
jgi:hypothetical protein